MEEIFKEIEKRSGVNLEYLNHFKENIKKHRRNSKLMYKIQKMILYICNNPNSGSKVSSDPRLRYHKIMLRTEYRIAFRVKWPRKKQPNGARLPTIFLYMVDTRENFYKILGRLSRMV